MSGTMKQTANALDKPLDLPEGNHRQVSYTISLPEGILQQRTCLGSSQHSLVRGN